MTEAGIRPVEGRFFDELGLENTQGKVIVLGESLWSDLGGVNLICSEQM